MARLSTTDQAFLLLETRDRPMNIGALIVLTPPARDRDRFADRIVARMLECRVGPPFSYRVKPGAVPPLLALEEDPAMDPATQVHRHELPRDSDLETLFRHVCELHAPLLPHDQPLWQQHVFTGLPGGRVALYFKTHHALIDGVGFLRVVRGIVSKSASRRRPHAIWEGMLATTAVATARAGSNTVAATSAPASRLLQAGLDALGVAWSHALRELGMGPGLPTPFVRTPASLKHAPSPNRVLAHCRLSLRLARAVARQGGAKVNDVMLTAIDSAIHRYLEEHGTPATGRLLADIPIALPDDGGTGNRIVGLQVQMGRPGATPEQRLRDIVHETHNMKQTVRILSAGSLAMYSVTSHVAASAFESLGLGALPMLANLVVSNPAGFEYPVFFNGAPIELALPVSVVMPHQVLNVTVTTYMDQLDVTFIAVREAIPDLAKLADYTREAMAQLGDAMQKTRRRSPPSPGKRRGTRAATRARRRAA